MAGVIAKAVIFPSNSDLGRRNICGIDKTGVAVLGDKLGRLHGKLAPAR